jgi:hypothetical protein
VVSLLKVDEAEMMVAARVDGGWIAVESEKAFTRLQKIMLRIVAMNRMCRMEPRSWIRMSELGGQAQKKSHHHDKVKSRIHLLVGGDDGQTFPVVCMMGENM